MTKLLTLIIGSILISSCALTGVIGSGNRVTESRDISGYSSIKLKTGADVNVTIDDTATFSISGDDNILDLITTEVKDGQLVIDSSNSFHSNIGIDITLTIPSLTSIDLDGAGDIDVRGVNNTSMIIDLDGAGDIKVTGTTESLDADLDGAGDMNLYDLTANHARVTVDGAGTIRVYASETLDATIDGAGDIKFKGNCSIINRDINGAGDIINKN